MTLHPRRVPAVAMLGKAEQLLELIDDDRELPVRWQAG